MHGTISGFERNGLVAFEAMENEGKKGLDGEEEEEEEVQQKKLEEEEVRKGMSKGESSSLSTLLLF